MDDRIKHRTAKLAFKQSTSLALNVSIYSIIVQKLPREHRLNLIPRITLSTNALYHLVIFILLIIFSIFTAPDAFSAPSPSDLDGDGIPNSSDLCDGRLRGSQIVLLVDEQAPLQRRYINGWVDETVLQVITRDVPPWLNAMTGKQFTVVNRENMDTGCFRERTGIFLATTNDSTLQAMGSPDLIDHVYMLDNAKPGSHLVYTEPGRGVWLVGQDIASAEHALYTYLEFLGMRFYGPTDTWTIIPDKVDLTGQTITLNEPVFDRISYFASGGFGKHDFGPNGIFTPQTYFEPMTFDDRWKHRIRLPVAYNAICGHSWSNFTLNYERDFPGILNSDPLHFSDCSDVSCDEKIRRRLGCPVCGPNGETNTGRQQMTPWNAARTDHGLKINPTHHGTVPCNAFGARLSYTDDQGIKWCEDERDYTSLSGAVGRYTQWLVSSEFPRLLNADNSYRFVNVDPSDGSGFDSGWKGLGLLRNGPYGTLSNQDASVSDRVFHLANVAARHVDQHFPGKGVCLLAYNRHALVPTIPLEPNMSVSVALGFHRPTTGLSNKALLDAWRQKNAAMGGALELAAYLYYNYPARPSLNEPVLRRSRLMEDLESIGNYDRLELETTSSLPAAGHLIYLLSRLNWDSSADLVTLADRFYEDAFGPAAQHMRRMFERWETGYLRHGIELYDSLHDLNKALSQLPAVTHSKERARIRDYILYLHYLVLLDDFVTEPTEALRDAQFDGIMRHLWKIRSTMMVQTYRLQDFLSQFVSESAKAAWDRGDATQSGWSDIAPYTAAEVEQLLRADLSALASLKPYDPIRYDGELTPVEDPPTTPLAPVVSQVYNFSGDFYLYTNGGMNVTINAINNGIPAELIALADRTPPTQIIVHDPSGQQVNTTSLAYHGGQGGPISVPISLGPLPAGLYHVRVEVMHRGLATYRFEVPRDFDFVTTNHHNSALANKHNYFYVPPGLSQIIVHCAGEGAGSGRCARTPRFYGPGDTTPVTLTSIGNDLYTLPTSGRDGSIWSFNNAYTKVHMLNASSWYAPTPEQVMAPLSAINRFASKFKRDPIVVSDTHNTAERQLLVVHQQSDDFH
jgi:hypothetical protein